MKDVKKVCLSCKHFRLESVETGLCRVNKGQNKNYPKKHKNDDCTGWHDCGQQYFIRLGWIKAKNTTPQ